MNTYKITAEQLDDPRRDVNYPGVTEPGEYYYSEAMNKFYILAAEQKSDPDGQVEITPLYQEGEYLDGYTVYGESAKLLEKIGLARYVDGWGYLVQRDTVAALGATFTYQRAVDLARPSIIQRRLLDVQEIARRESCFLAAKNFGKPVVLDHYMDDCNDPREDCDQDSVTVYAMPDGTTTTTRSHTW